MTAPVASSPQIPQKFWALDSFSTLSVIYPEFEIPGCEAGWHFVIDRRKSHAKSDCKMADEVTGNRSSERRNPREFQGLWTLLQHQWNFLLFEIAESCVELNSRHPSLLILLVNANLKVTTQIRSMRTIFDPDGQISRLHTDYYEDNGLGNWWVRGIFRVMMQCPFYTQYIDSAAETWFVTCFCRWGEKFDELQISSGFRIKSACSMSPRTTIW